MTRKAIGAILAMMVLGAGVTAPAELPPTVDQVLERYVQAVGGQEAIGKLATRVCGGREVTDLSWRPPVEVVPFEAWTRVPNRVLVAYRKSDGVRREAFDGETGWWEEAGSLERDDDAVGTKLAFLLNPQGPLRVRDYFPGLRVTGTEIVEGRSAYVLEPETLKKAHYSLFFDVETGLLIRIGYYWCLEDYRTVDGVRFPFRVVCSRKGGSTTYVFDEVRHNTPIDEAMFSPAK